MPDFSNFSILTVESIGIGLFFWAFFMLLAPMMAKRAGVAFEEPPLWLYCSQFAWIKWGTLVIVLYLAMLRPLERDIADHLNEVGTPVFIALMYDLVAGALVVGAVTLALRMKARSEAVVLEPLTPGTVAVRILLTVGILALLVGGPILADQGFGFDLLAPIFGGADKSDLIADRSTFFAILLTFILFWVVPESIAHRQLAQEIDPVWVRSSGLEYFRWNWLGLTIFIVFGILGGLSGLEIVMFPTPAWLGACLPFAGALIFTLFWVLPMRKLVSLAEESDILAREQLPSVRFSGVGALLKYNAQVKKRGRQFGEEEEKRLCPTCLRIINDINLYKDLRFDHCPHCQSFIPPVFTMTDFVKAQAERILPFIEEEPQPGQPAKKRRHRTEDEGRLVQDMIRALIALTIQERGTDLHLMVEGEKLHARCRTDGVLFTMAEFDRLLARPLISAVKVMANLNITERRRPQDGSFSIEINGRTIDIRINTSPVGDGEMAAMRLLYLQEGLGSLDKLGMSERNIKILKKLIHNPSGLVLVTGPTGSGKTTTLYNALEAIATGQRNIITLEDPIEHHIKGTTQMQVNANKGFTFATGLRSILRQDPDVIMVGEIRDAETAKMAIDAAATGHLVFSTLHATDTIGVIGRLTDLGIETKRLAETLLLVLAQRLVRLNCPACSRESITTREEFELHGISDCPEERFVLRRGNGCPHCHDTGYYGREGVHEFFAPNDELRGMIGEGASTAALKRRARTLGMRTLLEDGLVRVLLGRTTVEELVRVTS